MISTKSRRSSGTGVALPPAVRDKNSVVAFLQSADRARDQHQPRALGSGTLGHRRSDPARGAGDSATLPASARPGRAVTPPGPGDGADEYSCQVSQRITRSMMVMSTSETEWVSVYRCI